MTKLQQLNEWISDNAVALNFPTFRRQVEVSGGNLHWLRKVLKNTDAPAWVKELAALDIKELTK